VPPVAAPPVTVPSSEADGFVQLFNGKDLSGWHSTADKYFVTRDGSLLANPVPNEYGMLRTLKSYENYELRLQCRVAGEGDPGSKAHAGVALHVTDVAGRTEPTHGAYIWLKAGRASDMEAHGIGDVGEVKTFQQTKGPLQAPWNELRVVCQGPRITIFYNGEERWSCSRCRFSKGQIGLWTEEGDAYFRNIDIKPLPPSEPAEPWVPLFNGKELSGWQPDADNKATWSVEGGALTAWGADGYLATTRADFRDFHLRAEVKINKQGDSGVFFRPDPDPAHGIGEAHYEAEIFGGGYCHIFRREGRQELRKWTSDGVVPEDRWVVYELTARGGHIAIWADGRLLVETDDPNPRLAPGRIVLQSRTP